MNRLDRNKISTLWLTHIKDKEEREKFKSYIASSSGVLERLSDIIEGKLSTREVFKEEDYKDPSWAYECADRNGYLRALNEINELLKGK